MLISVSNQCGHAAVRARPGNPAAFTKGKTMNSKHLKISTWRAVTIPSAFVILAVLGFVLGYSLSVRAQTTPFIYNQENANRLQSYANRLMCGPAEIQARFDRIERHKSDMNRWKVLPTVNQSTASVTSRRAAGAHAADSIMVLYKEIELCIIISPR